MAEETNDDSLFQNRKIATKEPFDISRKCVEECASELDNLDISVDSMRANELSILGMNGEDGESIWLAAEISTIEGVENEWLKSELDLTGVTLEKNSLIDKLDTLARTPVDLDQTPSKYTNEGSLLSPLILPSNCKYLISQPVSNDAIISQPVSSTPAPKSPGGKLKMMSPQFLQEDDTEDTNSTIISSDQPLNSTFNKESSNSTFNKEVSPPTVNGLNSTFSTEEEQNLNSTFAQEGNATFDQTGNINATFDLSKEKSNTSVDTSERTDNVIIDTECDLKARSPINCVSESSVTFDSSNDSNDGTCHNSNPTSLGGQPGSEFQPKPEIRLGGDSIHPQLPRTRLPPPSRLQAPPQPRYPTLVRSLRPRTTPPIPREATVPAPGSGKIRNGLRPPMLIPRNVFKSPTAVHKTGLRQPAHVQDRSSSLPTSQQTNVSANVRLRPQSGLRPSAPVVESGLRKPSGIARPVCPNRSCLHYHGRISDHLRKKGRIIVGFNQKSRDFPFKCACT